MLLGVLENRRRKDEEDSGVDAGFDYVLLFDSIVFEWRKAICKGKSGRMH
jgi:hypothetical protein